MRLEAQHGARTRHRTLVPGSRRPRTVGAPAHHFGGRPGGSGRSGPERGRTRVLDPMGPVDDDGRTGIRHRARGVRPPGRHRRRDTAAPSLGDTDDEPHAPAPRRRALRGLARARLARRADGGIRGRSAPADAQPTDPQPTDAAPSGDVMDDGFDGEVVYDPYFISPEPDGRRHSRGGAGRRGEGRHRAAGADASGHRHDRRHVRPPGRTGRALPPGRARGPVTHGCRARAHPCRPTPLAGRCPRATRARVRFAASGPRHVSPPAAPRRIRATRTPPGPANRASTERTVSSGS